MRFHKGLAVVALVAAGITFAGSPAIANVGSSTVKVDGRDFGPSDGLTVTTQSFEIIPGTGATVGMIYGTTPTKGMVTPMATWGSSYATSTEYAYLFYHGVAKAAANVYSGQRIIKVCIHYTRNGASVADKRCSSASSTGSSWRSGPQVESWATDSTALTGPPTIFNIETTRINPAIY